MSTYRYLVLPQSYEAIYSFYYHVALKYRHTYSEELMLQNIDEAVDAFYRIENELLRRKPTLSKWQQAGYHMANTDKWYYAYTIDGDTITIVDACHAQNMK
jgi:hypothetical protein